MMLIKTKITTSLLMPLLQMALLTLLLMLLQPLSHSLLLPSLVLAVFSLHLLLFLAKSLQISIAIAYISREVVVDSKFT
jgi:hypothetical protein